MNNNLKRLYKILLNNNILEIHKYYFSMCVMFIITYQTSINYMYNTTTIILDAKNGKKEKKNENN